MVTPDHSVGERIRTERLRHNWSQEDLAMRVGVRGLAVGKWERNQSNPSTDNRIALAAVFGIAPEELGVKASVQSPLDERLRHDVALTLARTTLMYAELKAIREHLGIDAPKLPEEIQAAAEIA